MLQLLLLLKGTQEVLSGEFVYIGRGLVILSLNKVLALISSKHLQVEIFSRLSQRFLLAWLTFGQTLQLLAFMARCFKHHEQVCADHRHLLKLKPLFLIQGFGS